MLMYEGILLDSLFDMWIMSSFMFNLFIVCIELLIMLYLSYFHPFIYQHLRV